MTNDEPEGPFSLCQPTSTRGHYSGNPRDLREEATREHEEQYDPLEIWLDEPDSEYADPDFAHHVNNKVAYWKERLGPLADGLDVKCAGQSHKDLAWRWRYAETMKKTVNTFRKAVRHFRMFPQFTFVCSQPTLLEWTRRLDPELFEEVKRMVALGHFDLVGGCMNECDCRIPGGEAFVRQRLHGQRYYLRHFGRLSDVEWMPDTFGFAATLPQLLLKSGSMCFFTTKLGNNDTSTFPFHYFRWESPDGSQVLACFQAHTFNFFGHLGRFASHDRLLKPGASLRASHDSGDLESAPQWSDEYLRVHAFYAGAGDGKSGPMGQEVAEMRKLVEVGFASGWTTAHEQFARVKPYWERLPTWVGELYYEYHRGTLTTQHLVKRLNRKYENWLCRTEHLAAAASWAGVATYPHASLLRAWHALLLTQFHDVLPGSSIPEVYDDCHDFWVAIDSTLTEVERELACALAGALTGGPAGESRGTGATGGTGGTVAFAFNGLGFDPPLGLVEVPWDSGALGKPPAVLVDSSGNALPVVHLKADPDEVDSLDRKPERLLFRLAEPVPPLGWATFEPAGRPPADAERLDHAGPSRGAVVTVDVGGDGVTLDSGAVRVTVEADTNDVVVWRKLASGRLVEAARGNLRAFRDVTRVEPCWNVQPDYRDHPVDVEVGPVDRVTPAGVPGPLARASCERKLGQSTLRLDVWVWRDLPVVFLELLADWREEGTILRFEWTHATGAERSAAEAPHGVVFRPTRVAGQYDAGRWEMYGQGWVDVAAPDGSWGFAVVNEGKYGFDARGDRLGLTLLRGPEYPKPDSFWIRDERRRRLEREGTSPPTHADQGTWLVRFAALVHEGAAPAHPLVNRVAREYNRPLLGFVAKPAPPGERDGQRTLPTRGDALALSVEPANVELASVKRSEDDPDAHVLRFVEVGGAPLTEVRLRLPAALASRIDEVVEVDLLEREGVLDGARPVVSRQPSGDALVTFSTRAFEVVSLLVKLNWESGKGPRAFNQSQLPTFSNLRRNSPQRGHRYRASVSMKRPLAVFQENTTPPGFPPGSRSLGSS
ncbi:MAG: hypothetical protein Kow0069_10080 [Promethearchaeota archaeon]